MVIQTNRWIHEADTARLQDEIDSIRSSGLRLWWRYWNTANTNINITFTYRGASVLRLVTSTDNSVGATWTNLGNTYIDFCNIGRVLQGDDAAMSVAPGGNFHPARGSTSEVYSLSGTRMRSGMIVGNGWLIHIVYTNIWGSQYPISDTVLTGMGVDEPPQSFDNREEIYAKLTADNTNSQRGMLLEGVSGTGGVSGETGGGNDETSGDA